MAVVEPARSLNIPFIAAFAVGQAMVMTVSLVAAKLLFRRRFAEQSLFAMTAIFSNTGYMGIPLAIAAFGPSAGLPAAVATVFGSIAVIAVITAMIELGLSLEEGQRRTIVRDIAVALVRNPLIAASAAGIAWSFTGVPLPSPVASFCDILGAAAGPSALFAIGLFLVGKTLTSNLDEVGTMVVLKLVAHPAITWVLATYVFDVDPLWATIAVLMAALPTGANVFVLAQRYGIYIEGVSAATFLSTVLSVLTLSGLFYGSNLWVR